MVVPVTAAIVPDAAGPRCAVPPAAGAAEEVAVELGALLALDDPPHAVSASSPTTTTEPATVNRLNIRNLSEGVGVFIRCAMRRSGTAGPRARPGRRRSRFQWRPRPRWPAISRAPKWPPDC